MEGNCALSKTIFAKDITNLGIMLFQLRYLKNVKSHTFSALSANKFFKNNNVAYDKDDQTQKIIYQCIQTAKPKPSPYALLANDYVIQGLKIVGTPDQLKQQVAEYMKVQ